MNIKIPFHYKVLRYIHDSFTGEFLNIGLALYSKSVPHIQVRLLDKYSRITNTFPSADGEHYHAFICSLQGKFETLVNTINSKQLQLNPESFDELLSKVLPYDDSSIQFGPLQGGMAQDLDTVFNDLYRRLVEAYIPAQDHLSRTEQEIWNLFSKPLRANNVINLLRPTTIQTKKDNLELEHSWKNGQIKALQPVSFDLLHAGNIKKKAYQWLGFSTILIDSPEIAKVYYLLGRPRRDEDALLNAYNKAKDLLGLGTESLKVELIEEDAVDDFANLISQQIKEDTKHSK